MDLARLQRDLDAGVTWKRAFWNQDLSGDYRVLMRKALLAGVRKRLPAIDNNDLRARLDAGTPIRALSRELGIPCTTLRDMVARSGLLDGRA